MAHTFVWGGRVGNRGGKRVAPIEIIPIRIVVLVVPHGAGASRARLQEGVDKNCGSADSKDAL